MPDVRTIRNSQYLQQIQEVDDTQFASLLCEEGALIKLGSYIYVGIDGNWVQIAPVSIPPLNVGWERIDDGQYNISSPFNFSANIAYTVPNNGAVLTKKGLSIYNVNHSTFVCDGIDNTFLLTVAFKAHLNTNNGHMQMYLEAAGTTPYTRISDIVTFPKGNGVEHIYSKSFQFYADEEACNEGIQVKFNASHSGSIYDVIYFIQKIQDHA